MGESYAKAISKYDIIKICHSNIADTDAYSVGGPLMSYLEKTSPKVSLHLVRHLRNDINFDKAEQFFKEHKLPCSIKSELITNHLKSVIPK